MKAQFKQTRIIDGQVFNKGTHEVPVELEDHQYLKGLIAEGTVVIVDQLDEERLANSGIPPKEEDADPTPPQTKAEAPAPAAEAEPVKTTITEPSTTGETTTVASDAAAAKIEEPATPAEPEYVLGDVYEFDGVKYLYELDTEGNEAFFDVAELTYEQRHALVSEGKLDASLLGEAPADPTPAPAPEGSTVDLEDTRTPAEREADEQAEAARVAAQSSEEAQTEGVTDAQAEGASDAKTPEAGTSSSTEDHVAAREEASADADAKETAMKSTAKASASKSKGKK